MAENLEQLMDLLINMCVILIIIYINISNRYFIFRANINFRGNQKHPDETREQQINRSFYAVQMQIQ